MLSAIPDVVRAHSNFRRELPLEGESRFRFALHHRDDPGREFLLTILAFDVPS